MRLWSLKAVNLEGLLQEDNSGKLRESTIHSHMIVPLGEDPSSVDGTGVARSSDEQLQERCVSSDVEYL